MKFSSLFFAMGLLVGVRSDAQAQTPLTTSNTKKVHASAPELEVAQGSIAASSPQIFHTDKNLPQFKQFEAWVNVGARFDGPTPGPDDPPPGTWSYYFKPVRPLYGPTWDGILAVNDWLQTTETDTGDFGVPWADEGHAPGAGTKFQPFWEGNLNAALSASWKNGDPVYKTVMVLDPQTGIYHNASPYYQWSGIGETKLYVASDSTAAQKEARSFEASTQSKEFHIDFGDVDPDSLQKFPQTTAIVGYISDPTHPEVPQTGPLTAMVTWHIRPVTLYRLKIEWEMYNDGVPVDVAQQVYDIANAKARVVSTGAALTKQAINLLYMEPAKAAITGPLMTAGFHGAGSLLNAGMGFAKDVAEAARLRKAAELGVDASHLTVDYTVTCEGVSSVGTVTSGAAKADVTATSAEAAGALAKSRTATQNAEETLAKTDAMIAAAEAQEQQLRQSRHIAEADQAAQELSSMRAARAQCASDLSDAQGSLAKAEGGAPSLAALGSALAQAPKGTNFYSNLSAASGFARIVGSEGSAASSSAGFAFAGGLDAAEGADNIANIARGLGLTPDQLAAATNACRTFCETGGTAADAAQVASDTLFARNATKLVSSGTTRPQCFVAGTMISTQHGLRRIETLKKDDLVWSRDEQSGKTQLKPIVRLFQHQASATLVLTFNNGERIETTKTHPFYVEHKGFIPAGELGIGTSIVTRAGPNVKLVSSVVRDEAQTVFNFEVKDFHTYFVGSNELWVHNQCIEAFQLARDIKSNWRLRYPNAARPSVANAINIPGVGTFDGYSAPPSWLNLPSQQQPPWSIDPDVQSLYNQSVAQGLPQGNNPGRCAEAQTLTKIFQHFKQQGYTVDQIKALLRGSWSVSVKTSNIKALPPCASCDYVLKFLGVRFLP